MACGRWPLTGFGTLFPDGKQTKSMSTPRADVYWNGTDTTEVFRQDGVWHKVGAYSMSIYSTHRRTYYVPGSV